MSTETTRSRRAILLAAAGGTAAVVADAIARPHSAVAGTPVPVYRDQPSQAVTAETGLHNSSNSSDVFSAISDNAGVAIFGYSIGELGVHGASGSAAGVQGTSDSGDGVAGSSNSASGVHGESTGANGSGVFGFNLSNSGIKGAGRIGIQGDVGPTQTAVHGFVGNSAAPVPPAGVGVVAQAQSASLIALHVKGRAKFDRSGVVTVAGGTSSVTKTLAGVTSSSLILAVLGQDRAGVWVRAAVPSAGTFKVILNKNVASATKVTYFVLG
jgi:hypothetical protein